MRTHRSDAYLIAGLIAFGLLVKLLWLGRNELAHDEPFTVHWALQSWSATLDMLRNENNPPLFFGLLHLWSGIVPLDAAYLRIPSALFSALTVWPLFLIARALDGRRTALIAALLFTFSNYHYGFAHEVRAYALFTLLATWSMWLLVREKGRSDSHRSYLIALSLVNVAMLYTHFFGAFVIGIQLLCVLGIAELRKLRSDLLLSAAVLLLAYLPYMVILQQRIGTSLNDGTWLTAPHPEEIYNMVWRWCNVPVLAAMAIVVIAIALWRERLRPVCQGVGAIWTLVPLLGMFAISLVVPMYLDRYLAFAAPGFVLLFAHALGHLGLPQRFVGWPGAVAVAIMAFTFTPWEQRAMQPSKVVAQRAEWPEGILLIDPEWYLPTWTWASGQLDCFRAPQEEQANCLGGAQLLVTTPGTLPFDPGNTEEVVLIDAGSRFRDAEGLTKANCFLTIRASIP